MDGGKRLYSQFIILLVHVCFQLEGWITLTASAKSSSGAIVESLNRPEDCEIFAAEGDLLSVRFTESRSSTDGGMGNAREAMVTLGDIGNIKGWNEALLGACVGEERRLIIPATLAYSELPPSLQSNVNITYVIYVVEIVKPVPDHPPIDKLIDLGEEVLMTTLVVVTEETEVKDSEEDEDSEMKIGKGTTRDGGEKSEADDNADSLSFIQVLQFAVIPVAVILVVLVIYYLYKLRHPHKRTTFLKVSDLDPECNA